MDIHSATEEAYKKGYEDGKRDGVKYGRWIRTHFVSPVWACSECKRQINRFSMIGYEYCPYCGAKMDEVKLDDYL